MQALSDMCVLFSLVRLRQLYSHVAECRRRSYMSTFREGRVQSGRVRQGRTWPERGGSANSSISDSVRLEPSRNNLQVRSPQIYVHLIIKIFKYCVLYQANMSRLGLLL